VRDEVLSGEAGGRGVRNSSVPPQWSGAGMGSVRDEVSSDRASVASSGAAGWRAVGDDCESRTVNVGGLIASDSRRGKQRAGCDVDVTAPGRRGVGGECKGNTRSAHVLIATDPRRGKQRSGLGGDAGTRG